MLFRHMMPLLGAGRSSPNGFLLLLQRLSEIKGLSDAKVEKLLGERHLPCLVLVKPMAVDQRWCSTHVGRHWLMPPLPACPVCRGGPQGLPQVWIYDGQGSRGRQAGHSW